MVVPCGRIDRPLAENSRDTRIDVGHMFFQRGECITNQRATVIGFYGDQPQTTTGKKSATCSAPGYSISRRIYSIT